MKDDDARRLILARRARFIAAALTGAGITAAGCSGDTECGADPPSQSPAQRAQAEPSDATTDGNDASDAGPQICLSIRVDEGCP